MIRFVKILFIIFFIQISHISTYGQCDFITGQTIGIVPSGKCSPVTIQLTSTYTFDFVPSGTVEITYYWNDGAANTIDTFPAVNIGGSTYQVVQSHVYPASNNCSYTPRTFAVYNGAECASSGQNQTFTSWSKDNQNTGTLFVNPEVKYVCENEGLINFTFVDQSTFNCNIGVEPDKPNRMTRWVQFIYDTKTLPGDRIHSVTINDGATRNMTNATGTSITYPTTGAYAGYYQGAIVAIPYPADGPTTITLPISFPAGSPTGHIFEVTIRNWNYCNPYDDPSISGTPADPVDGDNAPITTTARIEIITAPPILPSDSIKFCLNTDLSVTVTPSIGGNIHWYNTNADALAHTNRIFTGTTLDPESLPVAYRFTSAIAGLKKYYVTEELAGCESKPSTATLVVREELTTAGPISCSKSTNLCPGELGIVFSVPNPPPPQTYGGPTQYIWSIPSDWTLVSGQGTRSITVNIGSSTGSKTVSTYLQYATDPRCPASSVSLTKTVNIFPSGILSGTEKYCNTDIDATTDNNPDIDIDLTWSSTGATPLNVVYTNGLGNNFTVSTSTDVNNHNPGLPLPIAGAVTTYSLVSITDASGCQAPAGNMTGSAAITVRSALPVPGTITGDASICPGALVTYTLPSAPGDVNGENTRYQWRESTTGGTSFDWLDWADETTGNSDFETDADQGIIAHTVTATTSYWLRVRRGYSSPAANSNYCYTSYTNKTISVRTLPAATLTGATTICNGSSTNLVVNISQGDTPFTIVYNNGTTDITVPNLVLGNNNILVSPTSTTSYHLVSIVSQTSPGCTGSVNATPVTITVNTLPTAGTDDPDATICQGTDFSFVVDLTGVAGGNFVLGYRINGGATQYASFNDYAHTLNISAALLSIGANTITLVSVTQQVDVSSPCSGTLLPDHEITINVDEPPATAYAGTDISLCNPAITTTLGASSAAPGTGLWTVFSQPPSTPAPVFSNNHSGTSNFTITSPNWGVYTLVWTTSNGVCPNSTDTVLVDFGDAPTDVNAGPDASICLPSYTLQGNTPTLGYGTWTYTGPDILTFSNPNNPESDISAVTAGTYTLTWTIASGACPPIHDDVTITFKQIPTINDITDITKCSGDASGNINFTATVGTTITWSNSNPSIGIGGTGSGNIASFTLKNTGTIVNSGTITVHGVLDGCNATDVDFDINVNPKPVLDTIVDITACPGELINVPDFVANTGAGATFNWTNSEPDINLLGTGTGNIGDFNATNTTSSNLTGNVSVTATLSSCVSNPRNFKIIVKPKPVINSISNTEICPTETYTPPTFTSTPAGATFSWTNSQSGIGLGTGAPGNIPSFTASNNITGANITGLITVSAELASCHANDLTYNISLKPKPVVTAVADLQVCPDNLVTQSFSANTGGLETFGWSNSNINIGLGSTGTGNISFTTIANTSGSNRTGTIKVGAIRLGCKSDSTSFNITNKPTPAISAISNFIVCPGESVNPELICTPAGSITWTNTQPLIGLAASGSNDIAVFNAASNESGSSYTGNITVNATSASCPATPQTFSITVKPKPVVNNIANQSACGGETVNPGAFTANTGGGETFTWTNTNTAIGIAASGSGNISYTAPANTSGGNYSGNINVTATLDLCQSVAKPFTITIKPSPQITQLSDIFVCPTNPVSASFTVSPVQDSIRWRFTDNGYTGTGNIPSFNAQVNNTGFNITRPVEVFAYKNACKSAAMNFNIIIRPTPQMVALPDIAVCPGENITPGSFQTNPTGSSFTWTNNNVLIGLPLTGADQIDPWIAANTTSDSIKATISVTPMLNSCIGTTRSFAIAIKPKPFMNPMANISVCPGETINVPVFSTTPTGSNFSWTNSDTRNGLAYSGSGNISSYTAPINTSTGNYTGTITTTANLNGCTSNVVSFSIAVKPTPGTSPISGIINVCASTPTSTTTQIYRTDLPSGTPGSSYVWTVTSSTPASAAPINYSQFNNSLLIDFSTTSWTGTIQVVETSLEGCVGQPRTAILRSYDLPVVYAGKDTSICAGGNVILGGFPTASGGSSSYIYNWAPASGLDDRTKANPLASPLNPVTYSVTVTDAISACVSQPDYVVVNLNALPAAPGGIDPSICDGEPTPDLTAVGTDIKWYLDEELTNLISTDNPFSSGYTTPGTYNFYATQMIAGCESAPREFTLAINSIPAKPDVGDVTICYGQSVPDLISIGTGVRWYDDAALTHLVKNGNVFTTGKVDPGTYTYYVTQTTNNCESPADTVILTIKPRPAAPVASDHTVCANLVIPELSAIGSNIRWYSSSFLTTVVDSGNNFNTENTAPGTYTYFATQTVDGCQSAAKTVSLVIRPVPEIISAFSTDETVCNSSDGKITVIASGTPPLGYSINGGISFTTTGNFASLGNGNYPIAVQNNYGCIDHGDTLRISSGSAPVKPIAGTNAIYCQGQSIANLFATPLSGGTINWYKDAALTTSLSNSLSYTPDNVIGTTYYYVTETYGGCESQSVNISITINALPTAPQINDTIVCTGMGIPTLHALGNNIYWYNDQALTQVINNGNYYVTGVTNAGNYTWYLASSNLGCRGPVTDVTLTIQETPRTPIGTNTTSCEGSTVPALTATGNNIHWYSNSSLTNQVNIGSSYNTGKTAPGDYKYYLVGDDGHCRSNASVIMQTIYAIPSKPIGLDRTICEEQPTPALVASGATIKWYSDANLANYVDQGSVLNVTHTDPGTYTYYATQTLNGCQSAPDTIVLLIKPKPAMPVAPDVFSCEGTVTPPLKVIGTNPRWYYLINQVGTGLSYSTGKTTPGIWIYGVTQTINGCESDPEDVQLTIYSAPVFSNTDYTDQTACNSNDGTITVYGTGVAPLSYSIDDGATYQVSNFFDSLKNAFYPVRIKNGYGCTKPGDTIAIRDGGAPKAPYALKDTVYCANNVFDPLEANASVGGTLTWYSDWSLKNILNTGNSHTPSLITGSTHYYVTETSGGCESDPTILTVSINLMPIPPFSKDTALCYGLPVPNLTAVGEGIEWFNDPSLVTVIGKGESYATGRRDSGVYVYYVTQLIDGCRSEATIDTLTIYPKPNIAFEPSVDQGCSPLTIDFDNTSSGSVFTWTFGDQTSENIYSPSHTYTNNSYSQKNYPVKLVANNKYNCSNSLVKFVTVFPFPNYKFSMVPDEGCHPVSVSLISPQGAQNYDWNFGDFTSLNGKNNSTTNTYENDTYDRDTSYVITLTATSAYGCSDTYRDTLMVHPNPDVSFTTNLQAECNPFTPIITNLSVGATGFRWNFGDNTEESTLANPTHTYNNTSAFTAPYIISLRAQNDFGCNNTFTQNIKVYPPMDAVFTSQSAGCSPFRINISNQSWGSGLSYYWTTSDYQSSGDMNPAFTFNNNGFADSTYTIRLIAQSQQNCFDTSITTVLVYARPKAEFLATPSQLLYPERTFNITQGTNDSPSSIWQYTWDFGDTISHVRDPQQHTYDTSGVYTIKLKVDGIFCFDTLSQTVQIVLPPPIAGFDSIAPDCSPLTVQFNNNTIYAETFRWAFGDGSFSNKKNPKHEYWDPGTYVVTLSVEGPGGKDSHQGLVTAHPLPRARFEIEPSFVYVPDQPVKGFNQSENGQIYEWDFGDSSAINYDSVPVHYYQSTGQYNVTLWVRTNTVPQCSDSLTKEKAVIADAAGKLKLPNAFRPSMGGSGGGYYTDGGYNNNIFYPPVSESVIEYKLLIFNRWGQKMFETKDIKQGWDGYFEGKLCEQGVYVWRVEGKYANKQTFVKMGDVTLLR